MNLFTNGYAIAMPADDFLAMFLDTGKYYPGQTMRAIDLSAETREGNEVLFKCYGLSGGVFIETEETLAKPLFSALMREGVRVLKFSVFDNFKIYGCAYYADGKQQIFKIDKPVGLEVEKDRIARYAALPVRDLVLQLIEDITGNTIETIVKLEPQNYTLQAKQK